MTPSHADLSDDRGAAMPSASHDGRQTSRGRLSRLHFASVYDIDDVDEQHAEWRSGGLRCWRDTAHAGSQAADTHGQPEARL